MITDAGNYQLYINQTTVLSAILQFVTKSYPHHLVTSSPESKILRAVYQIDYKHKVLATPENQRLRTLAGQPRARLVLAPEPMGGVWPFALLADRKLSGEQMRHVDAQPIRWPAYRNDLERWVDTYELAAHKITGCWTWYLVNAVYGSLTLRVMEEASAHRWTDLSRTLLLVTSFPQFGGINSQTRRILSVAKQRWGDQLLRNSRGQWSAPPWHKFGPPRAITPVSIRHKVDPGSNRPSTLREWLDLHYPQGSG